MQPTNPSETAVPGRPPRLPLVLSGVVLPGAGQFAQRRWAVAAFFGLGFLFTAAMFFDRAFRIIVSFYRMGLEFETYRMPSLPLRSAGVYFLASVLLYGAGLMDTWIAYRRDCSDWARRKARLPGIPQA